MCDLCLFFPLVWSGVDSDIFNNNLSDRTNLYTSLQSQCHPNLA